MLMRKVKTDEIDVKELARGRWAQIIGTLYPELSDALSVPGVMRCTCPVHGTTKRKGDGFRFLPDFHETGGAVCNTCGTFPSGIDLILFLEQTTSVRRAFEILRSYFGINTASQKIAPRQLTPRQEASTGPSEEGIKQREILLAKIWNESTALRDLPDDHPAIRYFTETRGIASVDLVKKQRFLRFHSNLFFERSDVQDQPPVCFPGIVSMMHGADGKPVGLHRTFMDHTRPEKAPVLRPKKILKRLDLTLNGSVRIDSATGLTAHANVIEGIENGMSVAYSTGRSVYVAGYATLLSVWRPTPGTKFVTIWCDRDENETGIINARKLQERLHEMNIECRILVPQHMTTKDEDWNDVLIHHGYEALAASYAGHSSSCTYL